MRRNCYTITLGEFIAASIILVHLIIGIILSDVLPIIIDWYGITFFVCSTYIWKEKTGQKYFSLFSILMLFFVLFNYGVPTLWAFGIHFKGEFGTKALTYGLSYWPSTNDIMRAQIYSSISMAVFFFGIILVQRRKYAETDSDGLTIEQTNSVNSEAMLEALKRVSTVMLCIFAPIALGFSAYTYTIARRFGYAALYYGQYQVQTGYMQILMYFFYPALFGFLIGNKYSKKSRIVAHSIFLAYAVLNVLSGDRGSWLYSLIILIWLNTYYTKTPFKKYIKYFILGIIGLYLLSAITSVRDTSLDSLSIDLFLSAFKAENNPIVSALKEMGGTMGIILYFLHAGNKIFPYANTYLTSFLGVISTRVLSLFGLKQVLIGDWFSQDYLGISWGTGFSMVGEAFVNGGYFGGFIYLFIIGIAHGYLLKAGSKVNSSSPLKFFITVAGLNAVIGFSRGALYLTLKELFYGVLIYAFIVWIEYSVLTKLPVQYFGNHDSGNRKLP